MLGSGRCLGVYCGDKRTLRKFYKKMTTPAAATSLYRASSSDVAYGMAQRLGTLGYCVVGVSDADLDGMDGV